MRIPKGVKVPIVQYGSPAIHRAQWVGEHSALSRCGVECTDLAKVVTDEPTCKRCNRIEGAEEHADVDG